MNAQERAAKVALYERERKEKRPRVPKRLTGQINASINQRIQVRPNPPGLPNWYLFDNGVEYINGDRQELINDWATRNGYLCQDTPVITWKNPTAINEGTPLKETELNATANTAGKFFYDPPAGTVLTRGNQTLTVLFVPDDILYEQVTATARIQVRAAQVR
jgi:hypothetical protein